MTILPPCRTDRIVVDRMRARMRPSGSRMRAVIRLHEPPEVDVRVALRGGEARVPEELLDGTQVGARAEQMRREGVAERMRRRLRHGPALEYAPLHEARHAPRREPAAARVPEDRRLPSER